jgi:putative phosphoribosyl transferase
VSSATWTRSDLPEGGRRFADRRDAGRRLARLLERVRGEREGGWEGGLPIVVGIARGGLPVAAEIARSLGAPLDVVVVRKIGAPMNPEYGIGALAEGGAEVVSERAVEALNIAPEQLRELISRARAELVRRLARYRGGRGPLPVAGRTVILVDDGLATGRTAQVAARSLRRRDAARVILAIPVAAPGSAAELREEVDEVVCVEMPPNLRAIGFWYEDFRPTSDEEVAALLGGAAPPGPGELGR